MDEINQADVTQALNQLTRFFFLPPQDVTVSARRVNVLRTLNAASSRDTEAPADNYITAVLSSSGVARVAAAGVEQTDGSELFTSRTRFQ